MRRRSRSAALSLLLLLGVGSLPAGAADAFYLGLLEEGRRAHARGDHALAARKLRVACFGFLDEPELLLEGLLQLGLAQSLAADESGFAATHRRVLELEERFGVYSGASLPEGLRAAFETELIRTMQPAELAASGLFSELARRQEEASLEALGPRERRVELERRSAAEPQELRWPLELARLEQAQDRHRRAARWLDRALALEPENTEARCLRGRSAAALGDCPQILAHLAACPGGSADPTVAEPLLRCRVRSREWQAAADLLETLPEEVRSAAAIAALAARVERHGPVAEGEGAGAGEGAGDMEAPKPAPEPAATGVPESEPQGPAPAAAPEISDQERLQAARIRFVLDGATRVEDLSEALEQARRIAEARPRWREAQLLAAEAAYLAGSWSEAADYFARGGPGDDQPTLLFYQAVSLYESGQIEQAADVLERSLPGLRRTEFVDAYVEKILKRE